MAAFRSLFSLTPLALAITLAHADHIDDNTAETTPTQLETIVVTGSKSATSLQNTPAAITRINKKIISENNPRLISDVLDRVPGVHMTDLGNEQHSMSIRQPMTTNPVYQYVEDNVPIRPIGVFNHNALNEINLAGIDAIEVMRGASSSLYGSNAVGGAVNFFTREPSVKPMALLGIRASDQGYRRIDVEASGSRENIGVRVSYYRSDVENAWRDFSEGRKDSLSARVDASLNDTHLLKTTLSYTDLYTDMTGSLGEKDFRNNPQKSYNNFTFRSDTTLRLSSSLESDWNANQKSRVTVFYRDNSHKQNPSYSLGSCAPVAPASTCTSNGRLNDNAYESIGIDTQWTQNLPALKSRIIAGLTFDHTRNTYDEDNLSVLRDSNLNYISYTVGSKRRQYSVGIDNPSAYAQAEIKPFNHTTFIAGLRHDKVSYDFTNDLTPSSTTGAPSQKQSFSKTSPRLGLVQSLNHNSEVFVNWSQGFVPPEVSQLYGSLTVPNLKESTFDNIDVGYRLRINSTLKLEANWYQLTGHDEIISYTVTTSPLVRENRNAGKTKHQGVELGLTFQPSDWASAYANMTWAKHEYSEYKLSSSEDYSGKEMPGAPEHMALAGIDFKPLPQLTISPEYQHIGAYWMNDANSVRYTGHSLWNLKARWNYKQYEVFAQLYNLTDKLYAETASSSYKTGTFSPNTQNSYSPGNPRTFTLGFKYHFGQ